MRKLLLIALCLLLVPVLGYSAPTTLTENLNPTDHDDVTDRINEIASEQNTMNTELYGKYVDGTEYDIYGTILNPQAVYANDATNHAITLVVNVPAAFTITAIRIACDADPTTEPTLTFYHKAAGVGYGTPTTIEAVTTTAGVANITTGIDDATIPANTKIFVVLSDPDDALLEIAFQIEGDFD